MTIQALGWREGGRYLPLQDDIASVAFWYQTLPTAPFPALPDKDYLEVIYGDEQEEHPSPYSGGRQLRDGPDRQHEPFPAEG